MRRLLLLGVIWIVSIATVSAVGAVQIDLLDFARIDLGMSEAEVLVRLGPPDHESFEGYAPNRSLRKSFFYFSEPERYQNITTVIEFQGGRVIRKDRIYRQN
jgi:hypothetical protein